MAHAAALQTSCEPRSSLAISCISSTRSVKVDVKVTKRRQQRERDKKQRETKAETKRDREERETEIREEREEIMS
jgi:hypothetical protein